MSARVESPGLQIPSHASTAAQEIRMDNSDLLKARKWGELYCMYYVSPDLQNSRRSQGGGGLIPRGSAKIYSELLVHVRFTLLHYQSPFLQTEG